MPVTVGHRQAETVQAFADNPFFNTSSPESHGNARSVTVTVNVRESAISSMAARGVLQAHQCVAARRFERLWLTFIGPGMKSPNLELAVSRHFDRNGLSEQQAAAASELRLIRAMVGVRCFRLLTLVCGEGRSLRELGLGDSRRVLASLADVLRWTLDDLAEKWGYLRRQKTAKGVR